MHTLPGTWTEAAEAKAKSLLAEVPEGAPMHFELERRNGRATIEVGLVGNRFQYELRYRESCAQFASFQTPVAALAAALRNLDALVTIASEKTRP